MTYDPDLKAKPTVYRNVEYRSKLEARWAVLLDHYPCVTRWDYEPGTLELRDNHTDQLEVSYTPDFLIRYPDHIDFILEIKPTFPNNQYLDKLKLVAQYVKHPVLVAFGGIYRSRHDTQIPDILTIYHEGNTQQDNLLKCPWFHAVEETFDFACRFRFDLVGNDYKPPRQRGSLKQFHQSVKAHYKSLLNELRPKD